MPSTNAHMAQPRAVRPASAGKLLALDQTLAGQSMPQMQAQNQMYQIRQGPATPHKQARYGYPMTPQSFHRRGAPNTLTISTQNALSQTNHRNFYGPTADLDVAAANFAAQFHASSADRASFPSLDSPISPYGPSSAHRGHARNNSVISLASSVGSAGSLVFPPPGMDFTNSGMMAIASSMATPPTSPKKRKSPSKSPSKNKDRPNYLDKAIMRDTGVTQEKINELIGDPTPDDPKQWRCLWAGCGHSAARKENIRAHVQTHLNDRPYECPECHNDFVRSHDFTRHYTTHVDSRDFKCPDCPQAFNRADALQRHRDRDFCNGPPPDSPSKVRRVADAIEKKKDTAGRRTKKQAARRRTTKRQPSAELSDDFWSSSAGSPAYFSSDAGSPEMILDSIMSDAQNMEPSQQSYLPMQSSYSTAEIKRDNDALDNLFATLSEAANTPSQTMSLSPPLSPHQSQSNLTPFSPSPRRDSHKRHEMTPPASRDSMLEFLTAPSVSGPQTVSSAPSLPDLSSTSPSPLAFEPVRDFDDFCSSLGDSNPDSWMDPRLSKSQAEMSFDFGELIDSKASASWLNDSEDLFCSN